MAFNPKGSCRFGNNMQHGQVAVARSVLQARPATCSWNPVQIGVAGQPLASELGWFEPLASELGWFDQCSWLLFNPNCSVGLWQICNVATLPGDSFAWQQVGNLQCQCSMGRLASSKCWICLTVQCWSMVRLAGAADLQHLAVARPALLSRQLEPCADWCGWAASGQ